MKDASYYDYILGHNIVGPSLNQKYSHRQF